MKNNNCFYCLNAGKGVPAENTGWYHPCRLGIANEGLQDVKTCPKHAENRGFQIGGYYTHMHFEGDEPNGCLEWFIHGDGEFPKSDEKRSEWIQFHICDFRQIEKWVEVWGAELRRRGLIVDEEA